MTPDHAEEGPFSSSYGKRKLAKVRTSDQIQGWSAMFQKELFQSIDGNVHWHSLVGKHLGIACKVEYS